MVAIIETDAGGSPMASAVLEAEMRRREKAARNLSLALACLGVLATLNSAMGPSAIWIVTLVFTLAMFCEYGLSFTRHRKHVAPLLMASVLLEHILIVRETPIDVTSPTPFFSSLVILIAASTMSYRGVVAAIVATFSALTIMAMIRLSVVDTPQVRLELPVPFILALTFAAVALVQSRGAEKTLHVQMEREKDLQLARQELKGSYEDKLRLSQELENSRRLESLGRLAGAVAHDFNNLLTIVAGSAEVAQSADTPEVVQRELDVILQLVERSAALNKQLLTFGKRMAQRLEPVELGAAVAALQAVLKRTVGDSVLLEWESAPVPLTVMADRSQLEQVLMNLTVNARDALKDGTSARPRILIRLRHARDAKNPSAPGYAELVVSDNGAGMPPEVQAHIFEPYFSTKREERGTGLGLSTVYGIVERWGGSIEVESAVGRGTSFTVCIPVSEASA